MSEKRDIIDRLTPWFIGGALIFALVAIAALVYGTAHDVATEPEPTDYSSWTREADHTYWRTVPGGRLYAIRSPSGHYAALTFVPMKDEAK